MRYELYYGICDGASICYCGKYFTEVLCEVIKKKFPGDKIKGE